MHVMLDVEGDEAVEILDGVAEGGAREEGLDARTEEMPWVLALEEEVVGGHRGGV